MKKEKDFEEEFEEECDEKTYQKAVRRKSFNKLLLFVCVFVYLLFAAGSFLPKTVSALICGAALALPVIISFIRKREKMQPVSTVFSLLCAAYLLFHRLINDLETAVTLNVVAIGVLLLYTLISFYNKTSDAVDLFLVIIPAFTLRNLYDAENSFHFVLPALLCGAFAAIVFFVVTSKKEKHRKEALSKVFFVLLAAALFAFFALGRLNFSLDVSAPRAFECVIEEKEYTNYRKGPDTYRFTIHDAGAEVEIDVPSYIYNAYDEGDKITIYLYEGAFGSSYYTFFEK